MKQLTFLICVICINTLANAQAYIAPDSTSPDIQNNTMPSDSSHTNMWTYFLKNYKKGTEDFIKTINWYATGDLAINS